MTFWHYSTHPLGNCCYYSPGIILQQGHFKTKNCLWFYLGEFLASSLSGIWPCHLPAYSQGPGHLSTLTTIPGIGSNRTGLIPCIPLIGFSGPGKHPAKQTHMAVLNFFQNFLLRIFCAWVIWRSNKAPPLPPHLPPSIPACELTKHRCETTALTAIWYISQSSAFAHYIAPRFTSTCVQWSILYTVVPF